ncbi:hypothetical protein MesoLjLa_07240 [Mesorhizobium sp. L-2-11]|nr:hypothetical protein MesoLjLa_07240 [Mesorhizobium sp. L-2-11]
MNAARVGAAQKRWRDSTPLCPAGHLPLKGEIGNFGALLTLATLL